MGGQRSVTRRPSKSALPGIFHLTGKVPFDSLASDVAVLCAAALTRPAMAPSRSEISYR
jgi:hypothetical protein